MPGERSRSLARRTTAARPAEMLAFLDRLPDLRGAGAAIFAVAALAAGTYAVGRGADANWDLHNYHLYNPYALLNGRLLWDIAPAGMQTYFHPGADLPFYWLVTNFPESPRAVTFAMGLPHAASALFLFLIARRLFPPGVAGRALAIASALVIGLTGAALLTTVGGTMNDYQVAPLALAGFYAALRGAADVSDLANAPVLRGAWLFAAGALLGVAVGLKLTFAPYGIAVAAALLCAGLPFAATIRALALYGAGAALTFAAAAGPWMLFLWDAFGSPLFPQFNDVFRSPDAPPVSFRDDRWFPKTVIEGLVYPFLWAFERSTRINEWAFRDPRIALALAASIVGAVALAWRSRRPGAPPQRPDTRQGWRLLAGYFAAGYAAWLLVFGYLRYLGPLELLSGLPIAGAIFLLARPGIAAAGLSVAAAVVILASTHLPPWQRLPFGARYFAVAVPTIEPKSLVLLIGKPMAYVAALMPRDARFVALANEMVGPNHTHRLAGRVRTIVAAHDGPVYVIEFVEAAPRHESLLAHHRLARAADGCKPIAGGDVHGAKQLCRLVRTQRP